MMLRRSRWGESNPSSVNLATTRRYCEEPAQLVSSYNEKNVLTLRMCTWRWRSSAWCNLGNISSTTPSFASPKNLQIFRRICQWAFWQAAFYRNPDQIERLPQLIMNSVHFLNGPSVNMHEEQCRYHSLLRPGRYPVGRRRNRCRYPAGRVGSGVEEHVQVEEPDNQRRHTFFAPVFT